MTLAASKNLFSLAMGVLRYIAQPVGEGNDR